MVLIAQAVVVVTGNVNLAAHDGLDDGLLVGPEVRFVPAPLKELLYSVHVTVVGNGNGWHVQLAGAGKKFLYIRQAVENRVLRMDVQMDK